MLLPKLPSNDWKAWVALLFGIAGGVAFTLFAIWMVWIFAFSGVWGDGTQQQRITYLGNGFILILVGSVASLLSLGFAINQRKMSIKTPGGTEVTLEGGSSGDAETLHTQTQSIENNGTVEAAKVQSS